MLWCVVLCGVMLRCVVVVLFCYAMPVEANGAFGFQESKPAKGVPGISNDCSRNRMFGKQSAALPKVSPPPLHT